MSSRQPTKVSNKKPSAKESTYAGKTASGKKQTGSNKLTEPPSSKTRKTTAAKSGKAAENTSSRSKKASEAVIEEPATKRGALNTGAGIVLGLLFLAFLELSNFNVFGKLGGWIKYGQGGLFGVMAFLFPVLVFLFFIIATFEEKRAKMYALGSIMFLFLCTFAHLMTHKTLSAKELMTYFNAGADHQTGGGIIGGAIALGLYLLLSKTGAIILSILIILACLFFIFEEPVRQFIKDRRDRYDDDDYDDEPEVIPSGRRSGREIQGSVYKANDRDLQDGRYRGNDRELQGVRRRGKTTDIPDGRYYVEESDHYSGNKRIIRESADDPIYLIEDEEGTVIRIVKSKKKKAVSHNTPLTRTKKKAQPLRNGETEIIRSENKVKGISNGTDIEPTYANGDEIHEITKAGGSRGKSASRKTSSRNFFDDTKIAPSGDAPVEWEDNNADTEKKKPARKAAASETSGRGRNSDISNIKITKAVPVPKDDYNPPSMELLSRVKSKNATSAQELERIADNLELILEQFGVNVTITDIQAGPSVTRFELQPELGTRVNKITSLADDLKLNLGVTEIRIEAPIPGRQAVGIEIPNKNRQTVYMRELLQDQTLMNHPSKIAFAAGKDISGNVITADIAKMPHLLVAGTTGSGKSVFLNTILMTILYRAKPSEVGLIIIDPKKVEFGVYAGIPHLMKDVVTDPGQAVSTLRWAVNEMTIRYQRMQLSSVRDFKSYNLKVEKGTVSPQEENPRKMNQIVIIIDELADLMMVAKKEAEALICRLAQLARAAGIHLVIATQRPSVDVVTGLIKANVPARVALLVSSQIDSRTIIDMPGAEKLLGNGDMLFYPTGYVKPVRIQGAFVSDEEIMRTVDYLIRNNNNDYFAEESMEIEKFLNAPPEDSASDSSGQDQGGAGKYDEFFYEAGKCCIEMGKASSSMLQRRFNLGFNRAARIIDQLEEFGAVGAQNGAKPREILVDIATFEEMYRNMQENR